MGTDYGAVDHTLPVIGHPQVYQCLQQSIPDTLLGPTAKPDIDRVPPAIALMYVPPQTIDAQDMQHAIEKQAVVLRLVEPNVRTQAAKADQSSPIPDLSDHLVQYPFHRTAFAEAISKSNLKQISIDLLSM
ncbi:hypothetical protein BAR24_11070 [Gluconobacter oxydans]|nr:hypothetical protein BAR24_11070 [Gluconobacter oxydans]